MATQQQSNVRGKRHPVGPCLVETASGLRDGTARLVFDDPVTHVYRPLDYAWQPHCNYLERFGTLGATVLLLGMNPGPFGMVQTGVPFGEVGIVRDWLRIEGVIGRPAGAHERRPVQGFDCPRGEISGQRLWGWARERFATPERFFARFFVWNYCPLAFVEASGRNRTPDKLTPAERARLYEPCDAALRRAIACLGVDHVVGIGRFAFARAAALASPAVSVGYAPHPSPASPLANTGWAAEFERALEALGIAAR
jgi:single-strand selective monofunctional uracil DNA glycosylase